MTNAPENDIYFQEEQEQELEMESEYSTKELREEHRAKEQQEDLLNKTVQTYFNQLIIRSIRDKAPVFPDSNLKSSVTSVQTAEFEKLITKTILSGHKN